MILGLLVWFKRWQYVIFLVLWLSTVGYTAYVTNKITSERAELKEAKHTIQVSEKRNEIANNRPDDAKFFDGLLNDSNW